MLNKRPLSVTIIGWFLLVVGIINIFTIFTLLSPKGQELLKSTGRFFELSTALVVISVLIHILAGIAILKGKNWGRLLYLYFIGAFMIIGWFITTLVFPIIVVVNLVQYGLILFFLTRTNAAAFFSQESQTQPDWPTRSVVESQTNSSQPIKIGTTIRKIIGGALAILGIFWMLTTTAASIALFRDKGSLALVVFVFYLIIGALLIIPSVFIWGKKEWQNLFGISFTIAGLIGLFAAVPMYFMAQSTQWQKMVTATNQTIDPGAFTRTSDLSLVLGVASLVILPLGIFLLHKQQKMESSLMVQDLKKM